MNTKNALLASLDWWTQERAEARRNGDKVGYLIADANRNNTMSELLKISKRSRKK